MRSATPLMCPIHRVPYPNPRRRVVLWLVATGAVWIALTTILRLSPFTHTLDWALGWMIYLNIALLGVRSIHRRMWRKWHERYPLTQKAIHGAIIRDFSEAYVRHTHGTSQHAWMN